MKPLLFVLFIVAGCTSSRPNNARSDTLLSGDATAKSASEAARKSEKDNNTGLINATSKPAQTAQQEPTTQPSVEEPPVLEVQFVKGVATMHGEPIVDFPKVAADAYAANPQVSLVITATEDVATEKVNELTDAAKAAGIKQFSMRLVPATHSEDEHAPPAEKAPAP